MDVLYSISAELPPGPPPGAPPLGGSPGALPLGMPLGGALMELVAADALELSEETFALVHAVHNMVDSAAAMTNAMTLFLLMKPLPSALFAINSLRMVSW